MADLLPYVLEALDFLNTLASLALVAIELREAGRRPAPSTRRRSRPGSRRTRQQTREGIR